MKRSQVLTEILLFFAAFFLPGYAAQGIAAPVGPTTNALMIQSTLAGIPQFLLMAWVVVARAPASGEESAWRRWGLVPLEPRDAVRTALLLLACFAVVAPFIALMVALPRELSQNLGRGYRWGLQSVSQLPLAFLFGLTAGYREEFFFRSYLLGRLDELGVPVVAAVAVSTIVFCLGHLYEGLLAVAVTAALGVLLSAAWLRRRSLHVVAIAHGTYNALVLCLGLVLPRALPDASFLRIF
jgi:membrane protease YdiL (CAAX protease family)